MIDIQKNALCNIETAIKSIYIKKTIYQIKNMEINKKIAAIVFLFLCPYLAVAQILTGVVSDKTTKQPISEVNVYLDGTSFKTTTDASGRFELITNSVINTKLVLNHLSYESAIINFPFDGLPDTLYVQERTFGLEEVVVTFELYTRKQKLKAFREQFLGLTRAGKSCTIENEDDIQLFYNAKTRTLTAVSDNPIVVVNNYLGYKISFILVDFWVQYYSYSSSGSNKISSGLDNRFVQVAFFSFVSSFTDQTPDSRRIKQRRDNIYKMSSRHFFKCLADDALIENGFTIFNKGIPVDHHKYFTTKDSLSQKMISIIPNTDIEKQKSTFTSIPDPSSVITVLYRKTTQSKIHFATDFLFVDQYGNFAEFDKIIFGGHMGESRVGDMLPIEYEIIPK